MPGQKINRKQIGLYMKHRKDGKSQVVAAAKAGFSERSARNIQKRDFQEAKKERNWRTKKDPFEEVWDSELVPMLERSPKLQALTLLYHLQDKYEDQFPDGQLRTLQRRVRNWRAIHGPSKEVIFRQNHPPGWQGLSDFSPASELGVTIQGEAFDHNLYHYRLAFSGWEHGEVVLGGESFTALAEGLQNALWASSGVPETHRTDSLSAAFKNLSKQEQEDLTERYENMCRHYGMEPTRNNRGVSHENGTIESSHRHLKSKIDQALMVRGSRDFESVDAYRQFVRDIINRHNHRIHKTYLEELAYLGDLPERKTTDYTEERVRVTSSSTISVKCIIYSVPSRLIGETIKVHLYDDRLECFVGGTHVVTLPRLRKKNKYVHQIDYRHLIGELVRKPGAFKNYIYKEELFPTLAFRQTWERLSVIHDSRKACREYVAILKEAAKGDQEQEVSLFLERKLESDGVVAASEVQALFTVPSSGLPGLNTPCDDLSNYDCFMVGGQS